MANRTGLLLLGTVSLAACSTIVGADFDDKNQGTVSTGGTSVANGGSTALGGQASGSAPAAGGGTPTGGGPSTNSAGSGGTTTGSGGSGGATSGNGGTAGAPSSGGTSGSGGGTAGGSGGMVNGQGGTTVAGSGGQDMAGAGAGGEPQAGAGGAGAGAGTDAGGAGAGGGGGAGGEGGSGPAGPPLVVLNEIRGQGEGSDFVELYNRGPGALALEGYGLSDENNTFIFPAGASIAEGGYLLLLLKQTELGGIYQCYTPKPCYHASWGVSKADGEWVYFRGRQNQVLDSIRYPAEGDPGSVSDAQTLSRFPNGTGAFRPTAPTPERANDTL